MSATRSAILKKPISDRISIFEKSTSTSKPAAPPPSSPVITSGRNISALKSQFSAAVAHDLEPPPKSPILIPKSSHNKTSQEETPEPTPSTPEPSQSNKSSPSETPKSTTTGVNKSKGSPTGRGAVKSTPGGPSKTPLKPSSSPTKTRKSTLTSSTTTPTKTPARSTRPVSPTKKISPSNSTSAGSTTTSKKSSTISSTSRSTGSKSSSLKSSSNTSKRPGSPTKTAAAPAEPCKKLSLSRILSPEPKKNHDALKEDCGETLPAIKELAKKDSFKGLLDRRDSSKSVLERKDSNKSVLERKDSNKSVLERRDSNKSALERRDSNKSFLERRDSNRSVSSVLERRDSNKSILDRKDSVKSVLDRKNSSNSERDELERKDSVVSSALNSRKGSVTSVFEDEEDEKDLSTVEEIVPVSRKESTHSVFGASQEEEVEEETSRVESPQESFSVEQRRDSIVSVGGENDRKISSLSEGKESVESLHGEKEDSQDNLFEKFEEENEVVAVTELNERSESRVTTNEEEEEEESLEEEKQVRTLESPLRSFPPPRCVTPKDLEEEEPPCPASLPTVKVTVEDIKLVKRGDSSHRLPPTTVVSDPEEDEYEDVNNHHLNLRNSSYSSGNSNKENNETGGYRRNSIEKHIDTRVINANYMKAQSPLVMNSTTSVSSPSNRYWTNQALQNDNSQTISEALKLDLEFKDEKINALNKELEDLVNGGAVEEEISHLKKQKAELDARLMDQEEELDDLAGQVQMLEQSKIKLEMSIAAQKKEHRKELSSKEEELEDARAAAQKRIKALEQQLENEHEERMAFVREKHDLESKIMNLQELASRSTDEEYVIKLKKNLKKTKALLKDAQCMIDMNRNDSSNKIVLRQLKNQLEDAEFAKTAAIKSRQNTEMELTEVQQQLDDVMRSKNDLEDKMMRICREKSDAVTQLEDNEEELSDIMKKYKAAVSQLSVDQITISQQTTQITELEEERHRLKETLSELNQKIDNLESDNISSVTHSRLELKIRELESKLELEQATRSRMETQIGRLKEAIEKYNHECDILRNKELSSQDLARKLQRQLRDSKEDYASLAQKEMEANSKKLEYEKQLELAEAEVITVKNDLKLALKRFDQLQASLEGDSSEGDCCSDGDSDSSDCEVSIFLDHHRRAMSVQKERESVARELSAQRELRASVAREMSLRPLETMSEHPEEAH